MRIINYYIKTFVLFLIISVVCVSFAGCEKEDECKSTETLEIKLIIEPNTFVWYKTLDANGYPIPIEDADVTFNIYKEYCSGKIAGEYKASTTTNVIGYAHFGWTYEYKFGNMEDVVYYSLIFTRGDNHAEIKGSIVWEEAFAASKNPSGDRVFSLRHDKYPDGIKLNWD